MNDGEITLYAGPHGARMQLRSVDGMVWLTRSKIADLYVTTSQNTGQIVRRVLNDGAIIVATTKPELMLRRDVQREVRREVIPPKFGERE